MVSAILGDFIFRTSSGNRDVCRSVLTSAILTTSYVGLTQSLYYSKAASMYFPGSSPVVKYWLVGYLDRTPIVGQLRANIKARALTCLKFAGALYNWSGNSPSPPFTHVSQSAEHLAGIPH